MNLLNQKSRFLFAACLTLVAVFATVPLSSIRAYFSDTETQTVDQSNLIVEFEKTPLFNEANFLPGEGVARWVKVTNNSGQPQKIAVEAINVSDPYRLGDVLNLEIKEGGVTKYSNTFSGFYNSGEVYFSDLAPGSSVFYNFSISFYPEASTVFQGKSLSFDILAGFQGTEGGLLLGVGGGLPPGLTFQDESIITTGISETSVTITWLTTYMSTSQVIYAAEGEPHTLDLTDNTGTPPKYGYERTTPEYDVSPKVTFHSVTISGLTPSTTYYYRTISHVSTPSLASGYFSDAEINTGNTFTAGIWDLSLSSPLVINEFLPNPIGDDAALMPNGEWVELYNNSDYDLDLTGWYIWDDSGSNANKVVIAAANTDSGTTIIPAHGWLVVYMNKAIFNNTDDTVRLFDADGMLLDSVGYCGPMAEGYSVARIPDGTGAWTDISCESTNTPPTLSFPTTGPYAGDGIDPNAGDTSTQFTFKIIYTDADNDPLGELHVVVFNFGGTATSTLFMSLDTDVSTSPELRDGNYQNGEQYTAVSTFPKGNYMYDFWTSDVNNGGQWVFGGQSVFTVSDTPPNQPPTEFWAKISGNVEALTIRSAPSTASANTRIKQLPNGWALWVTNTKNNEGDVVLANGYRWYQVEDVTDNTTGWIAAGKIDGSSAFTEEFLKYTQGDQDILRYSATPTEALKTIDGRLSKLTEAISNYYHNVSTAITLKSSNDGSNYLSLLKESKYPQDLLLAIAKTESDIINLNNEWVAYDLGHGLMQVTTEDVIGAASNIHLPSCEPPNDRYFCYGLTYSASVLDDSGVEIRKWSRRDYKKYKYYANTDQAIYANVKDGLRRLRQSYQSSKNARAISTVDYYYSDEDMKNISATYRYNQGSPYKVQAAYMVYERTKTLQQIKDELTSHGALQLWVDKNITSDWEAAVQKVCPITDSFANCLNQTEKPENGLTKSAWYLKNVANRLSVNQKLLAEKMRYANKNSIILWLRSPGELQVADDQGNITGLIGGMEREDIPNSVYDDGSGFTTLFFPSTSTQYKVAGIATGTYGLIISNLLASSTVVLESIPTTASTTHTYTIDWDALTRDEKGVTLQIDKNGDGVADDTVQIGATLDDTQAPNTTLSLSGESGLNGWFLSDVTTTLTAQDNDGGVGVEKTEYSLDNGASWQLYTVPLTITAEGTTNILYRSQDFFGNSESIKSKEIKIDKTPPEIISEFSPITEQFVFSGIDTIDPNPNILCTATICVVTDAAGHTTQIDFNRQDKNIRHLLEFNSLMYDGTRFDTSNTSFVVEYKEDKKGVLRDFDHFFVVKKEERIWINYDRKKDQSTIFSKIEGEKQSRIVAPGMKTLRLATQNGKIEASVK